MSRKTPATPKKAAAQAQAQAIPTPPEPAPPQEPASPPPQAEPKPGEYRPVEPRGLVCSKCGCRHWYTTNTTQRENCVRRWRVCRYCGHVVITTERITVERKDQIKPSR